jgi:hypothetical protein
MCTTWGYLKELCRGYGHNWLIWLEKPWNFIQNSSFLWTLFQNVCNIISLLFLWQLGHITWHKVKDLYFLDFFWISYVNFKMRPKRWAWPLLGWDRILRNSLWICDEMNTWVPKKYFWKKMSKLWSTCSSNLTRFQLNRQIFIYFLRGGYKTFSMQTTGELCIKYGIISFL